MNIVYPYIEFEGQRFVPLATHESAEGRNAMLQQRVATSEATVADLQRQLAAERSSSVDAIGSLLKSLKIECESREKAEWERDQWKAADQEAARVHLIEKNELNLRIVELEKRSAFDALATERGSIDKILEKIAEPLGYSSLSSEPVVLFIARTVDALLADKRRLETEIHLFLSGGAPTDRGSVYLNQDVSRLRECVGTNDTQNAELDRAVCAEQDGADKEAK